MVSSVVTAGMMVKTEALCGQVQRLPRLQHGVWGGCADGCWLAF